MFILLSILSNLALSSPTSLIEVLYMALSLTLNALVTFGYSQYLFILILYQYHAILTLHSYHIRPERLKMLDLCIVLFVHWV